MKISDLTEEQLKQGLSHFASLPNKHELTWQEFESAVGVEDIRPSVEQTDTNEWRGYVATRNMVRNTINGMGMDHEELGKRNTFQLRCSRDDEGNPILIKLSGDALMQDLLAHHQMKVQRAPKNMVEVMEQVNTRIYLASPKARNKLTNLITIGKVLLNQTRALIDTAVNDPDLTLPDFAHDELLRISYDAGADVKDEVEREEVEVK